MKAVLRTFVVAVALLAVGSSTVQAAPLSWDGFADFSLSSQSTSNTWRYLKANDPATESYDFMELSGDGIQWQANSNGAGVAKGAIKLALWSDNRMAALGWRSPVTGTVDVTYSVQHTDAAARGVNYSLYDGTTLLNSGTLACHGSTGTLTQSGVTVASGDILYLVLGSNGDVATTSQVVMTVTEVPEPATLLAPVVAFAADKHGPINVGDRKQLMIDNRLIGVSKNITLRMNPPAKMGPVLFPYQPWESRGSCDSSVVEDDGQYKMWYKAEDKDGVYRYCYACSKDGVTWEKPSLGLFEYNGSKDNNIVMMVGAEEGATMFLDPIGPPEARFKAIALMYWPDPKRCGLYVHTSADGIHWRISDQRVFPVGADTSNQAFYDSRLKKYVAYIRVWAPMRKVGRVETDDVTKPWPVKQLENPCYVWGKDQIPVASYEVPTMFGSDEHDPVDSDIYNPAGVQYPWADKAYFLFPSAYRHFPPPPISKYSNDGLLDIQMAVSRDGVNWTRLAREPYVALGTQDEIDCAQVYMGVGMVRRGGKIFQYYGGTPYSHGFVGPVTGARGTICRLEQRLDGFVSADAAFEGGEFTTPPLTFTGTRLVLNVNASAMGTCKVEILDEQGRAMPGYSLGDCDEVSGNHLEKTVSWKGKTDLSSLHGHAVRLRFVMRACKMFAFQFP